MTIYQRMDAVFQAAGVPGFLLRWQPTEQYPQLPQAYVVYRIASERCLQSWDDEPGIIEYQIEAHLYSVGDPSAISESIQFALVERGFYLPRVRELAPEQSQGSLQYHIRIDTTFCDFK